MNGKPRSGFTQIELMVVISLIGLLVAITLPAIQSVRESSRSAQCKANLAGLGQALHSFESSQHRFPPAMPNTMAPPLLGSDRLYSVHAFLLPHLDQTPLARKINLGRQQWYYMDPRLIRPAEMATVATTPIRSFLCPSDMGNSGNNYRVCIGPDPYLYKLRRTPHGGAGAFSALKQHSPADFRDGLSNTIAMSEKIKSDGNPDSYSQEDFWYTGALNLLGYSPPRDELIQICASLTGSPPDYHPYTGHTWYLSTYAYTWYNHVVGPNAEISDCTVDAFGFPLTPPGGSVIKASSYHTGGVNCLFMDGSVKFIGDSVDLAVWRALSTRAGGEAVSHSAY
jgi:prepilin-type N-terminal cleavage/methylation domain-containing protein/prepilin-type processing-associated H-X9-DG protein